MCICRLVARVMKILGIWPWFRVWPQKNFEDLHIKWYKNLRCGEEIQEQLDTTGSRPLHGSAPRGHWTLLGPGASMGQPQGVTGHYRGQAPPWVSPQGRAGPLCTQHLVMCCFREMHYHIFWLKMRVNEV